MPETSYQASVPHYHPTLQVVKASHQGISNHVFKRTHQVFTSYCINWPQNDKRYMEITIYWPCPSYIYIMGINIPSLSVHRVQVFICPPFKQEANWPGGSRTAAYPPPPPQGTFLHLRSCCQLLICPQNWLCFSGSFELLASPSKCHPTMSDIWVPCFALNFQTGARCQQGVLLIHSRDFAVPCHSDTLQYHIYYSSLAQVMAVMLS